MSSGLKATLMVLGAACVLLLAGGFPLMGAPTVYRGGAMLLLGLVGTLLSLWGAWCLAAGQRVRLVFGLLCVFFASVGVLMIWNYTALGIKFAASGGAMWMGALAMFCTALSGAVFLVVFGYLTLRVMTRRLWLAGVHVALALLAIGSYVDFMYELRVPLVVAANGSQRVDAVVTASGERIPLGFSFQVDAFEVKYYDTQTYTLYTMEQGRPMRPVEVRREEERLVAGEESWPVSALRTAPGMKDPYLLIPGNPPRVLVQNPPAVREYCADCVVHTDHRGRPETRREQLRVNEPISCKGWIISLESYDTAGGVTHVQLRARRAPGRIMALSGMVGVILCSAFWCWSRKADREESAA